MPDGCTSSTACSWPNFRCFSKVLPGNESCIELSHFMNAALACHVILYLTRTYMYLPVSALFFISMTLYISPILLCVPPNRSSPYKIDFCTGTIKMTRCLPQCCIGCQTECRNEYKVEKKFAQEVNTCCTRPFSAFIEDADDDDDEPYMTPETPTDSSSNGPVNPDFPDEPLEEGNRIWATGLFSQAEHIHATATISQ